MRRSTHVMRVLMLFVGIALAQLPLHAQFNAALRGTVTDNSGAVVPGATVALTDKGTNKTLSSVTDDSGTYTFNQLAPDVYSITAERSGFKKKVLQTVTIIPEQLNSLNIQLEVGEVSQSVTVTDTTQALDAETATVSGTISSNQIQHMPSYNRDVFQLAQLAPGVYGDSSHASGGGTFTNPGNQGIAGSSASSAGIFSTENAPQIQSMGQQGENNGISIDGISTTSAVWGGASVITPSEDSVQDMKVVSNSYDAENGRFSGAQIQVTSKSGTNQLHGSAFFKASRPGLNAYQRWNGIGSDVGYDSTGKRLTPAKRGLNRDDSRFNNYGGSLGGPIWKNKIFAFFNWETAPESTVTTSQGWYETAQFHNYSAAGGPIAAKYLSYPGSTVASNAIIPETCAKIGLTQGVNCNALPGGLDVGSPLTNGIGQQDPGFTSSSSPGVGAGLDGIPDLAYYNLTNPLTISQSQYNGRIDANLTQNDKLAFAIYWVPLNNTNYQGSNRPENLWNHSQTNDAFSVIYDHTFSPTLLNQARANAAGWRYNEVASNPQAPFGLPSDYIGGPTGGVGTSGLASFGANGPSVYDQWTYSANDVLTKVWGRQNIKVGGEFTRLYYLNDAIYAARPSFNFTNLWTFLNDAPYLENGSFNPSTGVPQGNREDDRENIWAIFVQDDLKLRPNLTLNLGVRYSYFGPMYSTENNLDVIQFGAGANTLTGINSRVGGNLWSAPKGNVGPNIGFAYQPAGSNGKLVIRGGFGISFNQDEIAITANGFSNPPNVVQPTFTCNPVGVASCAGSGVLYQIASSINSIFGYAPNPAAVYAFGSNNLPTTGSFSLVAYPSGPKAITVYHYSMDLQYQFPGNNVMSIGYQGNESRHLLTNSVYNVIAGAAGYPQNPLVNNIDYWGNNGTGNYNGLITSFNHNFSHTFQATAQYTWSKALDDSSGPYSRDPYPFDVHAGYGPSDYNVKQAFKLFGLWQPVIFRGQHNWAEKIAGGWSLSGIWNLHTGFPWNPTYGVNDSGAGLYYNQAGYFSIRPGSVISNYGGNNSNGAYMGATNPNFGGNGTTYFLAPTYPAGATFPNFGALPTPGIGRNSLTGPGYNDVDMSLSKAFGIPNNRILGEGAKLEFRVDTYNIFNKINLTSINSFLGQASPTGGISGVNSAFGTAGGALGGRVVQLQARFSF